MKMIRLPSTLAATAALGSGLLAQTTTTPTTSTGFAPASLGDTLFTSTPSDATGASGITSVFGSNGTTLTLGTGGALVNPAMFDYRTTGPNTATITQRAEGATSPSTTNLTFTSATGGTFRTTSGDTTSTGTFRLTELPSAVALTNVAVRTTLIGAETTSVGFVVGGAAPRQVLIRAIGPGLANFGVSSGLANPSFTLYRGEQAIAANDDWGTAATVSTGGSRSMPGSRNRNDDTNNDAGTGNNDDDENGDDDTDDTETGTTAEVSSTLATPQIFAQLGAFDLTANSRDAATVVTLPPGAYTLQVANRAAEATGAVGGTGTDRAEPRGTETTGARGDVLVEVYFVK